MLQIFRAFFLSVQSSCDLICLNLGEKWEGVGGKSNKRHIFKNFQIFFWGLQTMAGLVDGRHGRRSRLCRE